MCIIICIYTQILNFHNVRVGNCKITQIYFKEQVLCHRFNCTGDNYVIRREITKSRDSRGTSGWWVNGRTASQKSVIIQIYVSENMK